MYLSAAIKGTKETGVVPKLYFDIEAEMPEIKDEVQKRPDLLELGKQRAIKGYVNMNYAIEEKKIKSIKEAIYKYQNSALGILDNIKSNYNQTEFDVEALQKALADLSNSPVVKEILPLLDLNN